MPSNRIYNIGNRYLFVYLAFLSAFAPLSTDMYLPAMPGMAETYGVSNGLISLTISLFLLFFGTSMLFWGPMADRYGRKPILVIGNAIFIISSAIIAMSQTVTSLFFWRCVEAIGAGAPACIALAIVKDVLRGSRMERVLSWMQAATILAPMIAPVLGGAILLFINWRGIFWLLTFCGVISLLGVLPLKETARKNLASTPMGNFKRIGVVLQDQKFRDVLLLFSLSAMPFMTFLAVSAFIYQDHFRQSPQVYSLFFAFNAFTTLIGPFAHMSYFYKKPRGGLILFYFILMSAAGLGIFFVGGLNMWIFAILFAIISFCGSAMRPPSTVLIMNCIPRDNGVVASLINFGHVLFGSIAMFIAAFSFWPTPVIAVGSIAFLISSLCAFWWWKISSNY